MTPNQIDVLVVGSGPSGTALAIDLVRRGSLRRIYDLQPNTLLLVRPDGHVALIATRDWARQLEHVSSTLAGCHSNASGEGQ